MNIPHDCADAQLGHNKGLNRYFNVLPYDYNRVHLQGRNSSTGDGSGSRQQQQAVSPILSLFAPTNLGPAETSTSGAQTGSGPSTSRFINASFVQHNQGRAVYIATQGPLDTTTPDFWQMVWEQQCPAVVMLTRFEERGNVKCGSYFPGSESESTRAGHFEVRNMGQQQLFGGHLIRRHLQVSDLRRSSSSSGQAAGLTLQRQPLMVQHFQYMAWPDHGTPKDSRAIRFICDAVAQLVPQRPLMSLPSVPLSTSQAGPASDDTPAPVPSSPSAAVVVHCSAGIGRSGTYIAIDVLRQRLCQLGKAGAAVTTTGVHQVRPSEGVIAAADASVGRAVLEAALDLPALVHEMRQQRMGMVQTGEQYQFVYKALLEELRDITGEGETAAVAVV